mgnify:CR=1 FL=1
MDAIFFLIPIALGILLGNVLSGSRHSGLDIFKMAWDLEGHRDSTAAALYGGLVFTASTEHAQPFAVGLNCATGPEFMADHLRHHAALLGA